MFRSANVQGVDRYWLLRDWTPLSERFTVEALTFVMLNPSTADAKVDDATIRKCIGFANRLGYRRMYVVNLFSYRATDPRELRSKLGHELRNALHVRKILMASNRVVFAWGAAIENAPFEARERALLSLAATTKELSIEPWCLGTSKDGHPRHPLMLSYSTPLVPWTGYDVTEWAFLR